ncbi:DnaB-like helicase N-terminal domain-containing protein [Bacillus sp. OV166]|uniref:DnaB-like helicase N-terminal domain-containing protein n=1 Tax=Bacillus sp. OV166 TaxID=1882763 RepID=UPI000B4415F1|nr:DnaB-like helicase N-terminal domain-containing protein [Bacillus sp. OV166]
MLLGAVFLSPELIHEITLEPCHFSQKRNQHLFQALKELQNKNPTFHIESEIFYVYILDYMIVLPY